MRHAGTVKGQRGISRSLRFLVHLSPSQRAPLCSLIRSLSLAQLPANRAPPPLPISLFLSLNSPGILPPLASHLSSPFFQSIAFNGATLPPRSVLLYTALHVPTPLLPYHLAVFQTSRRRLISIDHLFFCRMLLGLQRLAATIRSIGSFRRDVSQLDSSKRRDSLLSTRRLLSNKRGFEHSRTTCSSSRFEIGGDESGTRETDEPA